MRSAAPLVLGREVGPCACAIICLTALKKLPRAFVSSGGALPLPFAPAEANAAAEMALILSRRLPRHRTVKSAGSTGGGGLPAALPVRRRRRSAWAVADPCSMQAP